MDTIEEFARKNYLADHASKVEVGELFVADTDAICVRTADTDDGQLCSAVVAWAGRNYLLNEHCVLFQQELLPELAQLVQ